jgi:hypothetical protein
MIASSRARRQTLRALGFAATAWFLVACGSGDTTSDPSSEGSSALEGADTYVGDQSGATPKQDPTRARNFSRTAVQATIAAAPAKAVLNFNWYGQETGYWCGPGSTRMALSTHMTTPPSQTDLANFMGTTKEGTVRADEIRALNNWLAPPTPYASIAMDTVPTQDQRDLLKATVVSRIASGWPVVVNVLSGWRPPGYPSGTIGHFVAVMGYDNQGDKVLIADPAADGAASARWVDVPKTYWIAMHDLGTWVGGRGYSGDAPPDPTPPDPTPAQ